MTSRRVAVTGAEGFLGRHVVQALGAGHERRQVASVEARGGGPVPSVEPRGHFDALVHLAWRGVPSSGSSRAADGEANLQSSMRVFAWAARVGVRTVVFASSGGTVYGAREDTPFREEMACRPASSYAAGKAAVEACLRAFARTYGLSAVCLRIANAYGPGQRACGGQGLVATAMAAALCGDPLVIWGDGSAVRDYVYAGDVAAAVEAAVDYRGPSITLNVGTGIGRSVRQVVEEVERCTGRPIDVVWRPGRHFDVPKSVLDIGLIRRCLHWTPAMGFADGLRRTRDWLRHELAGEAAAPVGLRRSV